MMNLIWKVLFILVLVTLLPFVFILLYAIFYAIFEYVKKAIIKKAANKKAKKAIIKKAKKAEIRTELNVKKTKADHAHCKKIKEWCKKFITTHKSMIGTTFFLSIMLGFPLFLQDNYVNISTDLKKFIKIGTTRDWFRFWSSYIASIMSIAFAFFNTKLQLKLNNKATDASLVLELLNITNKYFEDILIDDLFELGDSIEDPKSPSINDSIEKYWHDFNRYDDSFTATTKKTSPSTERKLNNIMGDYINDTATFNSCLRKLRIDDNPKSTDILDDCNKEINQTILNFGVLLEKIENLYDDLRIND